MYECLKKQFQGRIYRKPRDIEEFMDDILIYFKRGQTRRYDQDWEDRLYRTLRKLDPDQEWMKWTAKKRIRTLKKQGISLEVYHQKTLKEINEQKEKEIEEEIKRNTKNMTPIQAWRYRDEYLKNIQRKKETSDIDSILTEKLQKVYLKDNDDDPESWKAMKWKKFKKAGKKKGILEMKRLVNKWLGREKSDIGGRGNSLPNPVYGIARV
jgi:plasmid maintenance system killer protein